MVSGAEVWIYLGFFATLVAAGLGLPAPEELVITGAGVLAGQLPPEPQVVDVPVIYHPSQADVTGLLAVNPNGGLLGAVPWAPLVCVSTPRELSNAEVVSLQAAGLLAVNPSVGSLGGLPWAALGGASPPVVEKPLPPSKPHIRWWIMLPVCILGVVLSDILLYGVGRTFGDRVLKHRWLARALPPQRRRQTEENFHRYGVSILVVGRLMPGIRAPLFLTAGSMRLPLASFLFADGLGAVVGNSLFFFLGYWLGDSVKTLIEHAEERLKPILIIVGIGLVVAYLLWHFLRHPVPTGDPEEVPIIGPQVASHMECPDPPCPEEPPSDGAAKATHPSQDRAPS